MAQTKTRMQSMLFNDPTTYVHDFKEHKLRTTQKVYAPQNTDSAIQFTWQAPAVPFNLFHKPRPIVQTNPWVVQERYENLKQSVLERERAQRTRPRLVMTPAVSLDDIEDPQTRAILCEDMYTCSTGKALKEAVPIAQYNIRSPLEKYPAPANPITLPKLLPSLVSLEWRLDSVQWDKKQKRGHCDSTKEFWQARMPRCRPCDEAAIITAHRKLMH